MPNDGKLLAWIEMRSDEDFVAAFVGEGVAHDLSEDDPGRAPAMQLCSSSEEARQWVHDQADAIGLPIRWLNEAP